MPEAPIHKDRRVVFSHHDIRFSRHRLHIEPIAVPMMPQPLSYLQLRLGAFAVDVRHHKVTLFGGEMVGHNATR